MAFRFRVALLVFHSTLLLTTSLSGQITSYPHVESFELSNGGWTSGGVSSTWAWGVPADLVINSAGHGSRVWTTGLATAYNANERSTLTSPQFDMSSLTGPMLSCMIFRETEPGWDGIGLQYSTNAGATWTDFPTTGSNCFRTNWYSHASITYNDFPANNPGWSGNTTNIVGGGCSNGGGPGVWQTMTHCLNNLPANLAGQPDVRFRFIFGAGGICQDDGAAIDLFSIFESPVNADFTANCLGAREVEFEASSTLPGCVAVFPGWTFNWNFGDPASGIDNTATGWSSSHIFTSDGNYTITLTATNPCGNSVVVNDVVYVDMISCLLPEEQTSFTATLADQKVALQWETSAGDLGDQFMVQVSADGNEWQHLCAQPVENVSNSLKKGQCLDEGIAQGRSIYKLSLVTAEGETQHLALAFVQGEGDRHLTLEVGPNPALANGTLRVWLSGLTGQPYTLSLTDLAGRELQTHTSTPDAVDEQLLELTAPNAPGMYFLTLKNAGRSIVQRFLVI
jgi:PKD repeat protein